jgi:hypothetical protein
MVSRRNIHSCTGLKQTVLMAAAPSGTLIFYVYPTQQQFIFTVFLFSSLSGFDMIT